MKGLLSIIFLIAAFSLNTSLAENENERRVPTCKWPKVNKQIKLYKFLKF